MVIMIYYILVHSQQQSILKWLQSFQSNETKSMVLTLDFFKISAYSWTIDLHYAERTLNKIKETFNGAFAW